MGVDHLPPAAAAAHQVSGVPVVTCQSLGCYAMAHRRNLCRVHYELWRDQLDERPRIRPGGPVVHVAPFVGVCTCDSPVVRSIGGMWAMLATQCQRCSKPTADSLMLDPPERNIT